MWAEVRCRALGRECDMPTVLVDLAQERTALRELLRLAVTEQVRELRAQRSRCQQVLDLQYMTDAEIHAGAASGVVKMLRTDRFAEPDVDREVERALRAFRQRAFVVFVGGRQIEGLDDELIVRLGEPVVFLRLTALVGG